MSVKDNIYACYCNQQNWYFNVSNTSRSRLEILTSRLGLVSAGKANVSVSSGFRDSSVSVSSRSRLGLELLRLVSIPDL